MKFWTYTVDRVMIKMILLVTTLREAVIYVLAELGGTPPPLTENPCEKKKVFFLSGKGGYPPPLTDEFR